MTDERAAGHRGDHDATAFLGPYAAGPPTRALRVVAPSLTWFGWRELLRTVEIGFILWSQIAWAVAAHFLRHPRNLLSLRRAGSPARPRASASSTR